MCPVLKRPTLALFLIAASLFLGGCNGGGGEARLPKDTQPSKDPTVATLENVVTVQFSPGTNFGQTAKLLQVTSPRYEKLFSETAGVFPGALAQNTYQVTIDLPEQPPADTKVTLVVPAELTKNAPPNSELRVFYLLYQISEDEREVSVEPTTEHFDKAAANVTATVPPEAFATEETGSPNVYRAVLYLGFTLAPAGQSQTTVQPALFASVSSTLDLCPVPLANPIAPDTPQTSKFGARKHPITGTLTGHKGIDFAAMSGTPVLAVAKGRITASGFQYDPDTHTGWGNYAVLSIDGDGQVLYAHLKDKVKVTADTIDVGREVARSDSTGGSTRPHLHVEYAPKGSVVSRGTDKFDITVCIAGSLSGTYSGTFGGTDSGTFTVAIGMDGKIIGSGNSAEVGGFTISGSVGNTNVVSFTAALGGGATTGATFSGSIDEKTHTLSGTWENGDDSGSFSGQKVGN